MYCNLICICTQRACARPSCQVLGAIRALLARATALSHVLSRRPSRRSVLSRTRLTRLRGTRSPRRRRESVLLCRMMPNPWASLRTPGPSLSAHRSACGFCATRSQLGSTCSAAMSKQPHELSSPSPCDPSNGTGGCVGAAAHRSAAVRCGCSGSSGSAGAATAWAGWLLSMARNASFVSIATIVERRKRSTVRLPMLRRGRARGPNSASFRSRVTGKTRIRNRGATSQAFTSRRCAKNLHGARLKRARVAPSCLLFLNCFCRNLMATPVCPFQQGPCIILWPSASTATLHSQPGSDAGEREAHRCRARR